MTLALYFRYVKDKIHLTAKNLRDSFKCKFEIDMLRWHNQIQDLDFVFFFY